MERKKILIISAIILLILTIAVAIFLTKNAERIVNNDEVPAVYEPEFMNSEEKASFGLPEDSKIQVMKRNDKGEVDIYKIIREETDVE